MATLTLLTKVFLLVILTGSGINCSPLLESEFTRNGNELDDEFLDESVSISLFDPIALEGLEEDYRRLSLLLQPPTREFHITAEDTTGDNFLEDDRMKHSKISVAPTMFFQPSRFLEPPTREFGINPKKNPIDYRPVYSPIPSLENPGTSSTEIRKHLTSHLLPFGSRLSQGIPSFFAPLPSALISGSSRSFQTQQPSTESSEVKIQEQKKSTETSVKDPDALKKNKIELKKTDEGKVPPVVPEIQEPSRFLEPPTKEFQERLPRILVPPTREFSSGGSN